MVFAIMHSVRDGRAPADPASAMRVPVERDSLEDTTNTAGAAEPVEVPS